MNLLWRPVDGPDLNVIRVTANAPNATSKSPRDGLLLYPGLFGSLLREALRNSMSTSRDAPHTRAPSADTSTDADADSSGRRNVWAVLADRPSGSLTILRYLDPMGRCRQGGTGNLSPAMSPALALTVCANP